MILGFQFAFFYLDEKRINWVKNTIELWEPIAQLKKKLEMCEVHKSWKTDQTNIAPIRKLWNSKK